VAKTQQLLRKAVVNMFLPIRRLSARAGAPDLLQWLVKVRKHPLKRLGCNGTCMLHQFHV
jgi:hypothetical protein